MNIWYDFYQAVRRAVFEPLFNLTGYTPKKYILTPAEKRFISSNATAWPTNSNEEKPIKVLVHGHMASEGVNYLSRLGTVSKGIADSLDSDILVLLPRCRYNSARLTKLYESFGITKFLYLAEMDWFISARFSALLRTMRWFLSAPSVEDLLNLSYKGIAFGDVVYNDIIHDIPNCYTISRLSYRHIPFIFRFFLHVQVYDELLDQHSLQFLVTTHVQYTMFGTLVRLALARNIQVVETTDLTTSIFSPDAIVNGADYFSNTEIQLRKILEHSKEREKYQTIAKNELQSRMNGTLEQIDVQLAFAGKKRVNDSELRKMLGEDDKREIVCIFAHVFSDTPMSVSRRGLYRDYYEWLEQTLTLISSLKHTRWVLKPHPAQAQYGEIDEVRRLFSFVTSSKDTSISWCPEELSTDSLIQHSRAIVTYQGTIGLECSCFKVPAIIAGTPVYRQLGFTHEPASIQEYAEALDTARSLPVLSDEQQSTALAAYGALSTLMTNRENSLLDPDLLDLVWGYQTTRDLDKAYHLFSERLASTSLREQQLYHRARMIGAQSDQ